MKTTSRQFAAALLATGTAAQFVPAPTDLITKKGYADISVRYKEVPAGTCELDPNVKSYSGYADVEENQHIFWWFFEARNQDPSDAPLTVWINGGPGSSSMIGLFQENGPCYVDINGDVQNNPYSWSNASNMLFIDEPTQVGFSYSIPVPAYQDENLNIIELPNNTCPDYAQEVGTCGTYSKADVTLTANSTLGAAPNMWKTLQGFMGAFPQYARHGFTFTTESYGGHYGPVFNEYFEEQNKKNIPGAHKIDLQNVMIGNGWFDPLIQYQAYYNYTIYPGNTYDFDPYNDTVKAMWYNNLYGPGNCVDRTKQCYATQEDEVCTTADNFCANLVENLYDIYAERDEYDMREKNTNAQPDPFPYGYYVDYLNTPKLQAAIGAYQNFSESSNTVSQAFGSTGDDDRESGTIEAVRKLLAAGVQVTMYYGDADYNCNWLGGQKVAATIAAEGFDKAGFVNISTSDNIVHGQVKQSGMYSFVRIYESGHEVPFYQPLVALEMFERVLKQVDIATGKEPVCNNGYITHGTPTSTYREGNSTIQMDFTPANATYDRLTNEPDPTPTWPPAPSSAASRAKRGVAARPKPVRTKRSQVGKPVILS